MYFIGIGSSEILKYKQFAMVQLHKTRQSADFLKKNSQYFDLEISFNWFIYLPNRVTDQSYKSWLNHFVTITHADTHPNENSECLKSYFIELELFSFAFGKRIAQSSNYLIMLT